MNYGIELLVPIVLFFGLAVVMATAMSGTAVKCIEENNKK